MGKVAFARLEDARDRKFIAFVTRMGECEEGNTVSVLPARTRIGLGASIRRPVLEGDGD